jgi:cellulose synthase/poly-beta-1,6-N-acetylglucosamine synthase-like glycosyltransferase
VKRIPWNTPLKLVAGGYAAALALSVALIALRYLQYVTHPQDVAAYGGMYAGGDLALEVFIVGMFLVVTFFLMLVIAKSESAYTIYAKVVFGISLTLPFSVAFIAISAFAKVMDDSILGWACLFRLFASPMVLFGLGLSRLFARFPRPKKLTIYALLIESATLLVLVALLFFPSRFVHL